MTGTVLPCISPFLVHRGVSNLFPRFPGGFPLELHDVLPSIHWEHNWVCSSQSSYFLYWCTYTGLRFFFGTLIAERVLNYIGRFNVGKAKVPAKELRPAFFARSSREGVGFSPSQARFFSLVISSVLHGLHFIMMGSRSGFPMMFSAYVLAAFARAFLTGEAFPSHEIA